VARRERPGGHPLPGGPGRKTRWGGQGEGEGKGTGESGEGCSGRGTWSGDGTFPMGVLKSLSLGDDK